MQKNKILIFSTLYSPYEIGGAEKSTKLIAEEFANRNKSVHVICTANKNALISLNNVTVHYIKFKHIFWRYNSRNKSTFLKIIWRILEFYNPFNDRLIENKIKEIDPEIIFTNNIAGIGTRIWKIGRKMNLPILHTARDYYLICARSGMYKNKTACNNQCIECKIYSLNKKKHSQYVNYFVGVSKFVQKIHLQNGYFKNVIKTNDIQNIFQYDFKDISKKESVKPIKFGILGYIRETKGVNQLLQNINSEIELEIIIAGKYGEDNYGKEFLNLVYSDSRVKFLGYQEPKLFFEKIDYLIHPAVWHEPFPRTLIEAFSFGKPVIAGLTGGTKEAITVNSTGFTYKDYTELNEILKLITTKDIGYIKMSENCREYAKKFSSKKIIDKYLDLFSSC